MIAHAQLFLHNWGNDQEHARTLRARARTYPKVGEDCINIAKNCYKTSSAGRGLFCRPAL